MTTEAAEKRRFIANVRLALARELHTKALSALGLNASHDDIGAFLSEVQGDYGSEWYWVRSRAFLWSVPRQEWMMRVPFDAHQARGFIWAVTSRPDVRQRNYRCVHCGAESRSTTNHWGEHYGRCENAACVSRRPAANATHKPPRHVCTDPVPEGGWVPEPWRVAKLGDLLK